LLDTVSFRPNRQGRPAAGEWRIVAPAERAQSPGGAARIYFKSPWWRSSNSLRTGNLTGNFRRFGPQRRFSCQFAQHLQVVAPQFPEPAGTGNFFARTGNFSAITGNFNSLSFFVETIRRQGFAWQEIIPATSVARIERSEIRDSPSSAIALSRRFEADPKPDGLWKAARKMV
jgi:hypothetical protein